MAYKRTRASYEDDFHLQDSPFVIYGTPLPPLDHETRDDGSYVPIWKQEVTDERGRKRLHGAFTGGFSAGYFNTVGSKEGWTPSTFVSSRSNRRKDSEKNGLQRPEDFMDEEDLAEAAEAQKLHTAESFSGLGSTGEDAKRKGFMMDLLKTNGDTMGVKLLRKMGWRDGQGIGARVRRKAQLDEDQKANETGEEEHLFAPANSPMVTFMRKDDRRGLGFASEGSLLPSSNRKGDGPPSDEEELLDVVFSSGMVNKSNKPSVKLKVKQSSIGIGVLNDLGSDNDDPYEMGPRISYNRVIGGNKKNAKAKAVKSKPVSQAGNPLLGTKPVFISKKTPPSGLRKCHDGRFPLSGFALYDSPETSSSIIVDERWPRPKVPPDWTSSRTAALPISTNASAMTSDQTMYQSTANAARASQLDPKARAVILGEVQLPGKSVFDFLSTAARDRIAAASGRTDLPAGLGEAPPQVNDNDNSMHRTFARPTSADTGPPNLSVDIPELPKNIALAALGRGVGGWTPYTDDPAKLSRYRSFLEFKGGITATLPSDHRPTDLTPDAWLQELREFAHAAQVFRPMTGMMASRFTSSSSTPASSTNFQNDKVDTDDEEKPILLQTPATSTTKKPEDPAEAAAKMGMFGPMTRTITTFYPTRLVCKRFGVKPPAHVQPDSTNAGDVPSSNGVGGEGGFGARNAGAPADLVSKDALEEMMREARIAQTVPFAATAEHMSQKGGDVVGLNVQLEQANKHEVDAETNEALEGKKAGDAVFKAIFGSDNEDD